MSDKGTLTFTHKCDACGSVVTVDQPDAPCPQCAVRFAHRDKVLKLVEDQLNEDQQAHVIECGARMLELAQYYGPYFRYAVMLASAEVACGGWLLKKEAEFERADIMLPGGARALDDIKILIPSEVK